jgi:hypothetical protein
MNYHVRCLNCGATWWCRGDYESDTNATVLDDSKVHEGECNCGLDVEILEAEYVEDN